MYLHYYFCCSTLEGKGGFVAYFCATIFSPYLINKDVTS